jgi:chaperone modulatory protein CbpM
MNQKILSGTLLDEQTVLSLDELCHACSSSTEWVIELVEEGALQPVGHDPSQWQFTGTSLLRAHTAMRLQRDLGLNLAGIALALDLLDEMETMRARLQRLENESGA